MSDSTGLEGKSVLITGAAGGLGQALARRAAGQGARVVLTDLPGPRLQELARDLGTEAFALDVGDWPEWRNLFDRTGPWDYVFLNAGIMSAPPSEPLSASDFLSLGLDSYRRIVSVNIDGVAFGLKTAIPGMLESGGAIVVTASAAGLIPYPPDPTYSMTKHAIVGLVRSLAPSLPQQSGAKLRVCAICPGGVATPLVPEAIRGAATLMPPEILADEMIDLCLHGSNGEVRLKLGADQPAEVIGPPPVNLL